MIIERNKVIVEDSVSDKLYYIILDKTRCRFLCAHQVTADPIDERHSESEVLL